MNYVLTVGAFQKPLPLSAASRGLRQKYSKQRIPARRKGWDLLSMRQQPAKLARRYFRPIGAYLVSYR
jgi:hypothetical protein